MLTSEKLQHCTIPQSTLPAKVRMHTESHQVARNKLGQKDTLSGAHHDPHCLMVLGHLLPLRTNKVQNGHGLDDVCHATTSGGHSKLQRCNSLLDFSIQLRSNCASCQPADHLSKNNASAGRTLTARRWFLALPKSSWKTTDVNNLVPGHHLSWLGTVTTRLGVIVVSTSFGH